MRCAVGILHNPNLLESSFESFKAKDCNSYKIKPVGGDQVLMEFVSKEVMIEKIQGDRGWLDQWLGDVQSWVSRDAKFIRVVWWCMKLF